MIKIVLDTNQIISGSLWPSGPAGFILEKWKEKKIVIIVSMQILDELERVLTTKFNFGFEAADYLRKTLTFHGIFVDPTQKLDIIKEDPSDNMFLEAAIEGGADMIVTRDNDLLRLKEFGGIKILSPENAANWIRQNVA